MGGSANPLKPRYAAWQRALRHLTGVCFAGHAPFEPAHAAQIIVELLPLPEDSLQPWQPSPPEEQLQQSPPPLPPHAALDPSIEAPAEGVLLRTEPLAVGATHPAWVIDAADLMPPRAGALRGVVLVLRQLAPRRVAAAGEPSRVVWRQEVRFSALVHLHSDAATLAAALPATSGALLLTFADGVCVTPDVLESIRACGQVVLEPSAPLHARGGGGEAAPATAAAAALAEMRLPLTERSTSSKAASTSTLLEPGAPTLSSLRFFRRMADGLAGYGTKSTSAAMTNSAVQPSSATLRSTL